MKSWKLILAAVGLVAVVGAGYYGYNRIAAASTKKQTTTQTATVQKGTISETVTAQGVTNFTNKVDLSFGTSGTVVSLPVKAGDSVKKDQVLAKLDDLSIGIIKKAVAQAKVNLASAQDNLRNAKSTTISAVEIAQAEAAVAKARLDAKKAADSLNTALDPYASEEVAKAAAQVISAQSALDDNRRALTSAKATAYLRLQTDKQASSDTEDAYRNVFNKYLGMKLTDTLMQQEPETIMKNGNIKLDDLFVKNPSYASYDFYTYSQDVLQAIAAKSPPGVNPVVIYANLYLMPTLPTTDDIMKEFSNAWKALVTARDQYMTGQTQSVLAINNAEKSIAAAEDALRLAKKDYDDMKAGADPLVVAVAQKQLDLAKANLAQAEENLANKSKGPDPLVVALREAELAGAQAALDDALQKLENATINAPFDGYVTTVGASEGKEVGANAVVVSMVDPSQVQIDLTVDEIDIARVALNQPASITLDALSGTRLVGRVTSIVPVGRTQSGVVSYPVIVSLQSPAAQAGQAGQPGARAGQSGQPGQAGAQLPAGLREQIATARAGNRSGSRPTASANANVQLSIGMTATVDIIVQSKENVLLVTSRAIKSNQQGSYVEVVNPDGTQQQRAVTIGITDGQRTEIVDGLQEGDKVAVAAATTQTNIRTGGFPVGGGNVGFGGGPPVIVR